VWDQWWIDYAVAANGHNMTQKADPTSGPALNAGAPVSRDDPFLGCRMRGYDGDGEVHDMRHHSHGEK
jgi:hypothetical protein